MLHCLRLRPLFSFICLTLSLQPSVNSQDLLVSFSSICLRLPAVTWNLLLLEIHPLQTQSIWEATSMLYSETPHACFTPALQSKQCCGRKRSLHMPTRLWHWQLEALLSRLLVFEHLPNAHSLICIHTTRAAAIKVT